MMGIFCWEAEREKDANSVTEYMRLSASTSDAVFGNVYGLTIK